MGKGNLGTIVKELHAVTAFFFFFFLLIIQGPAKESRGGGSKHSGIVSRPSLRAQSDFLQ